MTLKQPPVANPEAASDAGSAEVLEAVRSGEIRSVIVGGSDFNGVFRAKRVPARRFVSQPEPFVEFSEYMWTMDLADYPQPAPDSYEGWWPDWATGFGDVAAVVDMTTLRRVPWLDRTALALCNYRFSDGRDYEVAPRNVLSRVVERYRSLGLEPHLAPEFEFLIFRETEESAIEKGFRDLRPLAPRPMAYGAMQATIDDHVIGAIVDQLATMGVEVEAWAPEGAAGQYELNLPHAPAIEAADVGFLFKHSVKEICALNGMLATFMPKLSEAEYGSSLHVHQSVWRDGISAFHDADAEDGMSALFRSFVAGQLQTLIPFAPLFLPTPTAYKRGGAYTAAGITESWGGDNKSLSLRVLAHDADSCRVEHRVPGADANVYLALAGMLAGGLYGIENELELGPATTGDAYADASLAGLPRNLDRAIGAFEQHPAANEILGEEFVRRYAATRRWEVEQSESQVTDWELHRYFVRS